MGTHIARASFSLVLVCTVILVEVYGTCTTGYITRVDPFTQAATNCCKISCPPDHQISQCTVNGTSDVCEVCPENSYQLDYITSDLNVPCRTYECPPETVNVHTFSTSGCEIPCICDVNQGMVGLDPCNCRESDRKCNAGMVLTIYDTCRSLQNTEDNGSDNRGENGSDNRDDSGSNGQPDSDNNGEGFITGIVIVLSLGAILALGVVTTVFVWRKRRPLRDVESSDPHEFELVLIKRGEKTEDKRTPPVAVVSPSVKTPPVDTLSTSLSLSQSSLTVPAERSESNIQDYQSRLSTDVGVPFSSSIFQSSETVSLQSTSTADEESSAMDNGNTDPKEKYFDISCQEN